MIKTFENFKNDDTHLGKKKQELLLKYHGISSKMRVDYINYLNELLDYLDDEYDNPFPVEVNFTYEDENGEAKNMYATEYNPSTEEFSDDDNEKIELINVYIDTDLLWSICVDINTLIPKSYGYQKYLIKNELRHELDMDNLHPQILKEYPYLKGGKRSGIL